MNGGQDEKKPQKMVRSSIACARCRRSKVKCKIRFPDVGIWYEVGANMRTVQVSITASILLVKLVFRVIENVHIHRRARRRHRNDQRHRG